MILWLCGFLFPFCRILPQAEKYWRIQRINHESVIIAEDNNGEAAISYQPWLKRNNPYWSKGETWEKQCTDCRLVVVSCRCCALEDGNKAPSIGVFSFFCHFFPRVLMLGVSHSSLSFPSRRLSKLGPAWLSLVRRKVTEKESRLFAEWWRADGSSTVVSAPTEAKGHEKTG